MFWLRMLHQIYVLHVFTQIITYLLIHLTVTSAEQMFSILMKFILSIISLISCPFGVVSKKPFSKPRSSNFFPQLFLGVFLFPFRGKLYYKPRSGCLGFSLQQECSSSLSERNSKYVSTHLHLFIFLYFSTKNHRYTQIPQILIKYHTILVFSLFLFVTLYWFMKQGFHYSEDIYVCSIALRGISLPLLPMFLPLYTCPFKHPRL